MSTAKQVLVFGSAGTGKTSFINALTGGVMRTGSGAGGVTLESEEIPVSNGGVDYSLIDTAGLNEAEKGSVSSTKAMKALTKLLARAEDGLNLIVMVVKIGRIHKSVVDNYKLFIETMTSNKVPLVIIVTHCERERGNMQGWVDANRKEFVKQGINAAAMVATTFATPDPEFDNVPVIEGKVRQSIELSWNAIREHATPERVNFMKQSGGFVKKVRDMYNFVVARLSNFFAERILPGDDYVDLVQQAGEYSNRDDAVKAVQDIMLDAHNGK